MGETVKLTVVAFATAADALGAPERQMEVPRGTRVEELRQRLEAEHPDLAPLWPRLAVAVDGELAAPETEIPPDAEVALLPPVSGGSPAARAPHRLEGRVALTEEPIDVERVTAAVARPSRGAVLLFLGTVRDHHAGRPVLRLTYSAYRSMAEERLKTIVEELEAGGNDLGVAIVHRLGEVAAGEPSVAIACASPHRAAAYEASRTALERLKKEVPIWKREHYADGEAAWREEEALYSPPSSP